MKELWEKFLKESQKKQLREFREKKNLESCKNPGAILDRIPTIVRESTWKEFREIPLKI